MRKRRPHPGREAHKARRRAALLEAALRVVRRDGPDATMTAMAAESGVTKPILYRYFHDRSGLIQAIVGRTGDDLVAELKSAMAAADDPRETLVATVDAYVAFIERDPQTYRFLAHRASTVEAQGLMHRVGAEVSVVMAQRMREAGADPAPAEPWAYGIVGMVHLAADWWLERRTITRNELVGHLSDLLWAGINAAQRARSTS